MLDDLEDPLGGGSAGSARRCRSALARDELAPGEVAEAQPRARGPARSGGRSRCCARPAAPSSVTVTGGRGEEARHHRDQRRLAGAVGPEQAGDAGADRTCETSLTATTLPNQREAESRTRSLIATPPSGSGRPGRARQPADEQQRPPGRRPGPRRRRAGRRRWSDAGVPGIGRPSKSDHGETRPAERSPTVVGCLVVGDALHDVTDAGRGRAAPIDRRRRPRSRGAGRPRR